MTSRLKDLLPPFGPDQTDQPTVRPIIPAESDLFRPDVERRELTRRDFMQLLGVGLLIAVSDESATTQRRCGENCGGIRGRRIKRIAARIHIAVDGTITIMTSKLESGEGSRAEITSAAAEELLISADRIQLLMADTALVADGSSTTPGTIPAVRQGCAAARRLLLQLASDHWQVEAGNLELKNGHVNQKGAFQTLTYADLANADLGHRAFTGPIPADIELTPLSDWRVLGKPAVRLNARDIFTGRHH